MTSRYAVAPAPPAGPGMTPEDGAIDHYLSELARWRMRREHELGALDALTRTHDDRDALNTDVTASMTLWHAIAQRHDLLLSTWQDAQAGNGERDWIAQLIWGLLELPDGDAQALAIALPEAVRLSDALAASLRARLHTDDDELPFDQRVAALTADTERVRAQLEHDREAAGSAGGDEQDDAQLDDTKDADHPGDTLTERLTAVEAEVEGLPGESAGSLGTVGDLESRLAAIDRDLIISAATQAHARATTDQASSERDHLVAKGEAVRSLAERVLNTVHPAPRLGIPDVSALGEVPEEEAELTAYMANLERVGRALDQAHITYAAALAEYADLADRTERLAKTLAGCGAPTSVDLAGMLTAAKESLHNRPADIQRAAALIAAQEAYLGELRPDA
ncbi:hypothetical protein [Ornithinimicrobium sp. Y1694]|uniref:hypothetical protein n=1 Tax=Ornithinimicrobium sp. Y1694 TaxID=3418590 RepID=UPI003CF309B3